MTEIRLALPLTAALIGVTWFHEVWTIYHTVAFACALSGIVLMAFSKSTEQATEQVHSH